MTTAAPSTGTTGSSPPAPAAVPLGAEHAAALIRFFAALPDSDVSAVKEDVRDPAMVAAAVDDPEHARRWVVVQQGEVVAYVALLRGAGLSAHVGELRLVVARTGRRQGLGRLLARTALRSALLDGMIKIVVEVPAEEDATAEVFRRLGFEGEALLRDQLRDRDGQLRDVLLLAHFAEEDSSLLAGLGVEHQ